MKIDIHLHTKKTKQGDSEYRNVSSEDFCRIIQSANVEICAITNHNCFDEDQFNEFVRESNEDFQIWPGIELDIKIINGRGHLLIIANPKNSSLFATRTRDFIGDTTADDFVTDIETCVNIFDDLDVIYIPHYKGKSHSLSDEDIDQLLVKVSNPCRVMKEATNSISAGIYINHGHKTIFGSDVDNWSQYIKKSNELPDLRLPVESFDQFCLLLERDDSTINTLLCKKDFQEIQIEPFKEDGPMKIGIYEDINVLFGSKGTGKTEILKELERYYNSQGYNTKVFESDPNKLHEKWDLKGTNYELNLQELGVDSCKADISALRKAKDNEVTSIKEYYEFFKIGVRGKAAKKIKLTEATPLDSSKDKIYLQDITGIEKKITEFTEAISDKEIYKEVLGDDYFDKLVDFLDKTKEKFQEGINNYFIEYHSAEFVNNLQNILSEEIPKKTGGVKRPITTGFQDYASNRIKIELQSKKIVEILDKDIEPKTDYVGNLGEKGKLYRKTIIQFQNGKIKDSSFKHLGKSSKTPEYEVAKQIRNIYENIYSDDLFSFIDNLNTVENGKTITTVEDLVLFKRYFELNNKPYKPSNGESSMILLADELSSDKPIYLIDEPEKSLGNDYINDFIVPILKEHAYSRKRVIIATHDANIAVRTLPYNSIYREHEIDCYRSYFGNPYSNNLICNENRKTHNWKDVSMRTLEGGKEAFGERGKIYGQ